MKSPRFAENIHAHEGFNSVKFTRLVATNGILAANPASFE